MVAQPCGHAFAEFPVLLADDDRLPGGKSSRPLGHRSVRPSDRPGDKARRGVEILVRPHALDRDEAPEQPHHDTSPAVAAASTT